MIVDDNTVILGSANINDRSMLGKRDSELAIIFRDRKREKIHLNGHVLEPGPFASSMRHTLFREHLGLTEGKEGVDLRDISSDFFYKNVWIHQAAVNTFVFDKVREGVGMVGGWRCVCGCACWFDLKTFFVCLDIEFLGWDKCNSQLYTQSEKENFFFSLLTQSR